MKSKIWSVGLLLLLVAVSTLALVKTTAFKVEGMNSEAAFQKVKGALVKTSGIQEVVGDPKAEVVMVRFDTGRANIMDIEDAVDSAGFTLGDINTKQVGKDQQPPEARRQTRLAFTDFNQVLNQTREALKEERYGLVRNLALAMKVRKDNILALQKKAAPPMDKKKKAAPAIPPAELALNQEFSRSVDGFCTAADARDKEKVNETLPDVRRSFRKLAEAKNFGDYFSPPQEQQSTMTAQPAKEKDLSSQLQDLLKNVSK